MTGGNKKAFAITPGASENPGALADIPDEATYTPPPPADAPALDIPDDHSKLEEVYHNASSSDPDQAASILGLANKTGLHPMTVAENLPAMQKADSAPPSSLFDQVEKNYPGTHKFLSDPAIMAQAHDDIPNVAAHEGLIQKADSDLGWFDTVKGMAGHAFEGYQNDLAAKDKTDEENRQSFSDGMSNIWGAGASALKTGALQEELAFTQYNKLFTDSNQAKADPARVGSLFSQGLGITASNPDERVNQINAKLQELVKDKPEGFIKGGLYGATSFLPMMASGIAAGAKYAIPAAGVAAASSLVAGPAAPIAEALTVPAAGAAGMAAGEAEYNYKYMAGSAADQLLKVKDASGNPLPTDIIKVAATAMGAANAGLGLVKLGAALASVPGGKEFLSKFTAEAGEKVLEDPMTYSKALKSFATNYVTSVAHGTGAMEGITAVNYAGQKAAEAASGQTFDHTGEPGLGDQLLETGKDALGTFGALGVLGAGGLSNDMLHARKTEQAKAFYTDLLDTTKDSKLLTRNPDALEEHIGDLADGTKVQDVYTPIEAMETYFQSKNIDPAAVMEEMGMTKAYEEAKATGADVKIPLETWVSKLVGTGHDKGLANDIKFDPDDFTARELNQSRIEANERMKAVADRVQDEAVDATDTPEPEAAKAQPIPATPDLNGKADIQKHLEAKGLKGSAVFTVDPSELDGKQAAYDPVSGHTLISKDIAHSSQVDSILEQASELKKQAKAIPEEATVSAKDGDENVEVKASDTAESVSRDVATWRKLFDCVGSG